MALADKTNVGASSVTSIAKLSSLLNGSDTGEDGNWAVDPVVPTDVGDLNLTAILHALSDPVRLRIVSQLADGGERTCGSLDLPVAKSTCSHHFRVLREAGVVAQRLEGKCRFNRLRMDELEQRFPGLLDAVLRAQGPSDPQRA
jgi:DNA-binding transcriptional ArsR family regulator